MTRRRPLLAALCCALSWSACDGSNPAPRDDASASEPSVGEQDAGDEPVAQDAGLDANQATQDSAVPVQADAGGAQTSLDGGGPNTDANSHVPETSVGGADAGAALTDADLDAGDGASTSPDAADGASASDAQTDAGAGDRWACTPGSARLRTLPAGTEVGSGSVIYGADALHWIHLTRGQNSTLPPSYYDRAGITARPRDNELSSASNVTVVADAGHLLSYLHPGCREQVEMSGISVS